jgi:hypothetical protein
MLAVELDLKLIVRIRYVATGDDSHDSRLVERSGRSP